METQLESRANDGQSSDAEEQRRSPRVDVCFSAELVVGGRPAAPVQVTNLSVTGCYVQVPSPPPVESRCEVRMFPDRSQPSQYLEMAGRVAHRQRDGFGMEFTVVDGWTQQQLARIVG